MTETRTTRMRTTARGPTPRLGDASSAHKAHNGEAAGDLAMFGKPGRRFSRTTPFFIGLTGALGVAVGMG